MIRKKKKYERPKKPFEKTRIEEENKLRQQYALKNKQEIWKTLARVNYMRDRAKALAKAPLEEQEVFFNKLRACGLKINSTADVLGLRIEDLLNRRLQTIVYKKGIANTIKHARQLVVHKKIIIDNRIVNAPSYLVPLAEEDVIAVKLKKGRQKDQITQEAEKVL